MVADVTVTWGTLNVDATQAVSARTAEAPPASAGMAAIRTCANLLIAFLLLLPVVLAPDGSA
jgi:hypothetical protein